VFPAVRARETDDFPPCVHESANGEHAEAVIKNVSFVERICFAPCIILDVLSTGWDESDAKVINE